MIGGAAWITARPADPMLWPPRDGRIVDVYVISNGYHAGLALPRARLAEFASGRGYPALIAVTQRFRGVRLDRVRLGRARILSVGADRR